MNAADRIKDWFGKYKDNLLINRLISVLSIDILVKLSGILLLPIYLRLMTQEEYGLYGYLLSIILTFSLVLNFGLYIPLSKYYHDFDNEKDIGQLLFTIFCLLFGILLCVIIPIYLFGWDYAIVKVLFKNQINYPNYRGSVLLALIATICNFMLTNFFFTSEKIKHLKQYNILRIVFINLFTLSFLYILADKDKVRTRLETTYLIEFLLFLCFMYVYARETHPVFNKKIALSGLRLGLPVMLSAVFGIIINFSDKFFLEKYGSFKEMSYYYLAVSCASVIPMIFASFQNAWLPLFLKEKNLKKNIARTNKLLVRLFFAFIALSLLILVFLKILLLLGIIQNKYQQTLYILPILLFSQIIAALVPLYTNYLVYFEKTHIVSATGLIISCVSLGLSILLIPRFGVYGAGFVSVLGNACYFLIYYFIVKEYKQKRITDSPILAE